MFKRFYLILFFLILISWKGIAQRGTWALTFTPALVETSTIRYGLQMGSAYTLNSHLQLLTEGTVALGQVDESNSTHTRFFRLKPELRYFLASEHVPFRTYLGLQVAYAHRSWVNPNSGVFNEGSFSSDSVVRYASANVRSPFLSFTTQFGGVLKLRNRISLDGFIGLGVKSVFTSYSNIKNPEKALAVPVKCRIMFRPDPAWWVNGTLTRFQFNTGIRIIYRL